MEKKMKKLMLEGVRVGFKNFKGEERDYNRAGARNFCVFLDAKKAEELEDEGWHIRWREPKNDGDERSGILQIKLNFKSQQSKPKVVMIIDGKNTELDEDAVKCLDDAEIESADIIANPYEWAINGNSGVAAYLQAGYFNVIEDEFYNKYYKESDSEEDDLPF